MSETVYTFHGKDITMNVCIQIKAVIKLVQEQFGFGFMEAAIRFYKSQTYKVLQNTENALWAESAEYIMDRYLEEPDNGRNSETHAEEKRGGLNDT